MRYIVTCGFILFYFHRSKHMINYVLLTAILAVIFISCQCLEWPEPGEDVSGYADEYVVEFYNDMTPDDAHNVIKSSADFQVEQHHPLLGNVFRVSRKEKPHNGDLSRRKRETGEELLRYFRDHPAVSHASQLEILVREKREVDDDAELFETDVDQDAVIIHNKDRDFPSEKNKESDFYRVALTKKEESFCSSAVFSDPLFNDQWQICNAGQTGGNVGFDNNILPVWIKRNITGRGVKVCILDDGIDFRHPDLLPNFDPRASLDLNERKKKHDPTPRGDEENAHGTKCAGVVAAVANNSKCGVGIAFNAKIGGIRMLDGRVTDLLESEALTFNIDYIDIFSASWGPTDDGKTMAGPKKFASRALKTAVTKGRGGLGSIFIWATGNGGRKGDDCNADGYVSNVNVISIGSVDEVGGAPIYMEECSSTMAVVFVGGPKSFSVKKPNVKMVTVDINEQCTEDFTGTSAAAPAAAGIAALMLEANPRLTYRDVMHIIVNTALSDGLKTKWFRNAAGHTFSRRFGFGRLDADRLVGLALEWKTAPALHVCESNVKTLDNVELYPNDVVTIELETNACHDNNATRVDYAEHVQLYIDLAHPRRGDVNLTLVSPAGTHSMVLSNRRYDTKSTGIRFAFTSTHFWGEKVDGVWKVLIGDNPIGPPIQGKRVVNRVGLALLGTVSPAKLPADFIPPTPAPNFAAGSNTVGLNKNVVEVGSKVELEDNHHPVRGDREMDEDDDNDNPLYQPAIWQRILNGEDGTNELFGNKRAKHKKAAH